MRIIPFIYKKILVNNITMHSIKILTIGGTTLWHEDDHHNVETDLLHPNEIWLEKPPTKSNSMYLCKVDPIKTQLNDFYKWDEIPVGDTSTFCWRLFYIFGENADWLPIPTTEMIDGMTPLQLFQMIHDA
jgi:hypothetical protein